MALRTLTAAALMLAFTAAAPKTNVIVFSPWSASGLQPAFTVVARVKGSCFTNSISTGRADAWRCMVGNDIYDPCFASASGSVVACADDPFARRVRLVTLDKAVSKGKAPAAGFPSSKDEPWALRLSTGEVCQFITGATDEVQGMRLNYGCKGNDYIVGFPVRSASVWTGHFIVWPGKKQLKPVPIATAVF